MPPPSISLRPVLPADLPALFEQQSDPEACRLAAVYPRTPEAFAAHWDRINANPQITSRAILADGRLAGSISCFPIEGEYYVGYWLDRACWGQGVISRALPLFLAEIRTRPLHARVARHNTASIRALQRQGFTLTGYEHSPATERFVECEEAMLTLT